MRTPLSFVVAAALLALPACKKEAPPPPPPAAPAEPPPYAGRLEQTDAGTVRVMELAVTEKGFEPSRLAVKKGEPVRFVVTRKTDDTCATELLIAGTDLKLALPLNQPASVTWTPTRSGEVKYGCAMGMMVSGVLLVE